MESQCQSSRQATEVLRGLQRREMTEEMKKEKCNSQASAMNKNEQLFLQTALNLLQKPRQIHLDLKQAVNAGPQLGKKN